MRPSAASSADAEMPKSMISACSSSSAPPIMMLAGFRSRWTTPASCAASRPPAICRASRSARAIGSLPSRRSTVARSSPWMYGIVMYLMPSISPEIVNADHVLVRDLAGEEQLVLEALFRSRQRRAAPAVRANHLQRDRDAELRIPGLIDGAHAADAEDPDDVIARAERLADGQWSGAVQRRGAHFRGGRRSAGFRRVSAAGGRGVGIQPGGGAERAVRRKAGRVDGHDAGRDGALGKRRPARRATAAEQWGSVAATWANHGTYSVDTDDYRRGGRPLPSEIDGHRPR